MDKKRVSRADRRRSYSEEVRRAESHELAIGRDLVAMLATVFLYATASDESIGECHQ